MQRWLLLACLIVSAPAFAQADPERAYQRFHQDILSSFNPPQWFSHLPAEKRDRFQKDTQASLKFVNSVQFMKDEMPRTYTITSKTPGAGGKSMRLAATGQGKDFHGKPQEQAGVIDLVQERGEWKVNEVTWGKRKLQ